MANIWPVLLDVPLVMFLMIVCVCVCVDQHRECGVHTVRDPAEGGLPV